MPKVKDKLKSDPKGYKQSDNNISEVLRKAKERAAGCGKS